MKRRNTLQATDNMIEEQLDFKGKNKSQIAIERIQFHEPPDGYWLAFSGGKDSVVILDLAKRSGVKFQAHYSWTGVDPPELYRFVKQYHPEVEVVHPEKTMWKLIEEHQMLPLRTKRFCCEDLKEKASQGKGYTIITGIRWAESVSRRNTRRLYELCQTDGISHYLHPIIDWSTSEVWDYIHNKDLPYCSLYDEGFKRIGCVLCPMSGNRKRDIARWPKIALAYRHAAERLVEHKKQIRPESELNFKTGEEYFNWWVSNTSRPDKSQMCLIFEDQ